MTELAKKYTHCMYCGSKIPLIDYQIPKFVKKSQKEGKR